MYVQWCVCVEIDCGLLTIEQTKAVSFTSFRWKFTTNDKCQKVIQRDLMSLTDTLITAKKSEEWKYKTEDLKPYSWLGLEKYTEPVRIERLTNLGGVFSA